VAATSVTTFSTTPAFGVVLHIIPEKAQALQRHGPGCRLKGTVMKMETVLILRPANQAAMAMKSIFRVGKFGKSQEVAKITRPASG
jgi:hypothetical protein